MECYGLVFPIAVFLTEMEWTETIRSSILLQSWTSRGLFYIFIGLFTYETHKEFYSGTKKMRNALFVVSCIMMTFGLVYSFMGLIYLKKIRDQKLAHYIGLVSNFEMQNAIRQNTLYYT